MQHQRGKADSLRSQSGQIAAEPGLKAWMIYGPGPKAIRLRHEFVWLTQESQELPFTETI